MALKIIGTSFGRTGTHSLKLALEQIGFSKCYHMEDLLMNPSDIKYWKRAKAGKEVDWDKLFNGYEAAVDMPAFIFYRELMKKYPEAKLIHTMRNHESWYRSFRNTIIRQSKPSVGKMLRTAIRLPFSPKLRGQMRVHRFAEKFLREFFPEGFERREKTVAVYGKWSNKVLEVVPRDKLLVFDIRDGWAPLCNFLEIPVPSVPFPHSNTTAEFNARTF